MVVIGDSGEHGVTGHAAALFPSRPLRTKTQEFWACMHAVWSERPVSRRTLCCVVCTQLLRLFFFFRPLESCFVNHTQKERERKTDRASDLMGKKVPPAIIISLGDIQHGHIFVPFLPFLMLSELVVSCLVSTYKYQGGMRVLK